VIGAFPVSPECGSGTTSAAVNELAQHPKVRYSYDQLRARGETGRHTQRQPTNRLVGILHTCVEPGVLYNPLVAGPQESEVAA
jgi:hypothetical protein